MGKGTIKTKAMTMAVAMSMVAGLCPSTVFAANSEVVAKVQDGTYTGTAECTPDGDGEFTKYNLSLSVTVEDGKIKSIDNVLGDGDRKNKSYIGDATDGYDDYIGVVKQIWCSGQHKRRKQLWTSPCGKYLEENKTCMEYWICNRIPWEHTGFQRLCCHDGTDDQ